MIFVFPIRRFSFSGTYRWGDTGISLQSTDTSPVPFKCLVCVINCLIMRGWTYEGACTGWGDWEARNRYHRNSLEEGALYTFPKPTSTRVGEESDPRSLYFLYVEFRLPVLIGGEIQRSLYNPRIHRPIHLNV